MLTAKEAGALLRLSARAVYQLAKSGAIPCHRMGEKRGAVRFDPADVEAYRTSCRSVGARETSATASISTESLKVSDTGLASYFRAAGVRPKLTHGDAKKKPASMPLQLVSDNSTR